MSKIKPAIILFIFSSLFFAVNSIDAATSKIGVLSIENFLMGDVTIPVEVFGRATKKEPFSGYEVVVISGSKNKEVVAEEGLKIIADKTIHDDLKLDVLIVPGAYNIDGFGRIRTLSGLSKTRPGLLPGWPVTVPVLFCSVQQVCWMEKKRQHGLAAKNPCRKLSRKLTFSLIKMWLLTTRLSLQMVALLPTRPHLNS